MPKVDLSDTFRLMRKSTSFSILLTAFAVALLAFSYPTPAEAGFFDWLGGLFGGGDKQEASVVTAFHDKHGQFPGEHRGKGKKFKVKLADDEKKAWPVELESGEHVHASIESLHGMSVIQIKPYSPWWKPGEADTSVALKIRGLPENKKLYVYTKGYREEEELTTDDEGVLSLDVSADPGVQLIIKEQPSTYNIEDQDGGGDCDGDENIFGEDQPAIGTWIPETKTCKLFADVFETIAIQDNGVTLDGDGHTVSNPTGDAIYTDVSDVTVKNVFVKDSLRGIVYSDSLFTFASGGTVRSVILTNNDKGIRDEGVSDLDIGFATISGSDIAVSLFDQTDGHATDGILLRRNNFLSNTEDLVNDETVFTLSSTANGGNYWSKFTDCVQESADPDKCSNDYVVAGVIDSAPWACKNGWRDSVDCPYDPGTGGGGGGTGSGDWAEVRTSNGFTVLRKTASDSGEQLKRLPNAWVVKVTDQSDDNYWEVTDVSDDTSGYIKKDDLDIDSDQQETFEERADVFYDTRAEREPVIITAVENYYDKDDSEKDLYSVGGARSGTNNFNKVSDTTNFPMGIVMGMIADESGSPGHALNNEVCNDNRDGGVGILQTTTKDFKGLGSGMTNYAKTNDCDKDFGWEGSTSKYYSNNYQGIHANIKDAYRIIQIKNNNNIVRTALATTSDSFFEKDGLVIKKKDMGAILTVRAYNGWGGERCFRVRGNEYIKKVGNNMLNIDDFFGDYLYTDSAHDRIAAKLVLANKHKQEIYTCSPLYLQILNGSGKLIAGYNGASVINTTDRVIYDEDTYKNASIIFPADQYSYRLVGTGSDTYELLAFNAVDGVEQELRVTDVPITEGAVHLYTPDWDADQVTVKVDSEGDGEFEAVFTTDLQIDAEEFSTLYQASLNKMTICHVPPGNPGNAHTISVGKSAWNAHQKHGDYEGQCDGREVAGASKENVAPGQAAKEEKKANVPKGKAKGKKK